jgi:hypothetical protein
MLVFLGLFFRHFDTNQTPLLARGMQGIGKRHLHWTGLRQTKQRRLPRERAKLLCRRQQLCIYCLHVWTLVTQLPKNIGFCSTTPNVILAFCMTKVSVTSHVVGESSRQSRDQILLKYIIHSVTQVNEVARSRRSPRTINLTLPIMCCCILDGEREMK